MVPTTLRLAKSMTDRSPEASLLTKARGPRGSGSVGATARMGRAGRGHDAALGAVGGSASDASTAAETGARWQAHSNAKNKRRKRFIEWQARSILLNGSPTC